VKPRAALRRIATAGTGLLVLALTLPMCTGVPLTAPSNSSMTLFPNPRFIPANGGVSLVTATVIEPAGTPVPNGTVVFFITNLGTIDREARTKDGIARVNLVSDSRSGTATVTAFSGGVAVPQASPSATPTPTVRLSFGMGTALADNPGTNSASDTVDIGSALPSHVIVQANPARITTPRSALITANVFDKDGNPVANVPVIFKVAPVTGILQETLDSGSVPVFTDTNGQAFDTLRTRALFDPTLQKTVEVSANLPVGDPVAVTVFIN
jgi:hypothetical protein